MWICCQIGAREHYAVPRALHRSGQLAQLFTDFWAGKVIRGVSKIADARWKVGGLRALAERFHPELEGAVIKAWNLRALKEKWKIDSKKWKSNNGMRAKAAGQRSVVHSPYMGFIEAGRAFAGAVRNSLQRSGKLPDNTIVFAYDTAALEVFEWCRERGIPCILDQMDPSRIEMELVREEERRWPGWATRAMEIPDEYFQRREREWVLADRIVVNSEFCRQALVRQGVPSEKLVIIPLAFEENAETLNAETPECKNTKTSLRVLFLGQVILRKGIQYLMEAARKLEKENVHFNVVGPIGISKEAVASAPGNMIFHGQAARSEADTWYRGSDLFVLPTLSDGFAITQLEAMSRGLPVISTPCCGDVVSDGVDGFIVPSRDAEALAKAFGRYLAEPELLTNQRQAALTKAKQFTLERLGVNLIGLEKQMGNGVKQKAECTNQSQKSEGSDQLSCSPAVR